MADYPPYRVTFIHPGGETEVMEGPHTDVVQLEDAKVTIKLAHGIQAPVPGGGFAPNLRIELSRQK